MLICEVRNVSKVNSVNILRAHTSTWVRPQYHVWVWYGEEGVYEEKSVQQNVHEEEGFAYTEHNNNWYETNEKNVNEYVDHVDKMMERVEDESGKCPRVFDLLIEASQKPLYPRCKKFTKLTTVSTILLLSLHSLCCCVLTTRYLRAFLKRSSVEPQRVGVSNVQYTFLSPYFSHNSLY